MCNCYSYNWCVGETPEVILDVPKELTPTIKRMTVCIDACIVDEVKALWKARIITHCTCCGHNRIPASVVLEDNVSQEVIDKCKRILSSPFELYSWMDSDKTKITRVG